MILIENDDSDDLMEQILEEVSEEMLISEILILVILCEVFLVEVLVDDERKKNTQDKKDIKITTNISLKEAHTGIIKNIAYTRLKKVTGAQEKTCKTCK
jgi:DnaJ-class molecular chaperone